MKRDWDTLTFEYLAFDGTLEEFSKRKKIPLSTIRKQSSKLNWSNRKSENGTRVERKAEDLLIEDSAAKLAEQNARDLAAVEAVHNKAVEMLAVCDKPSELRALSGVLKDMQAVARLALGVSTENANVNMVDDFESWLRC